MAFAYYDNLSRKDQRTYRKSDGVEVVRLPARPGLRPAVDALRKALAAGSRAKAQRVADKLCREITSALRVAPVGVKVMAVRPRDRDGELHGLYTAEEGKRSSIEVWMRTARHKRVVAFRTFLRTLLHELCHHLDFTLFGFEETFHTEGFFKRESSLFKQLVPEPARRKTARTTQEEQTPKKGRGRAAAKALAPGARTKMRERAGAAKPGVRGRSKPPAEGKAPKKRKGRQLELPL